MTCARCGLTRGSEVTDSDQQSWANAAGVPAPATAAERPGWQRWLRFWWIPALAIALLIGWFTTAQRGDDGSLTSAGNVSVTDLRAGDCFIGSDEEEISDVDGVPCDESHEYEVFAVQDREGETYPTEAEFDAIFESICVSAFGTYVGIPYADSVLWATMITPVRVLMGRRRSRVRVRPLRARGSRGPRLRDRRPHRVDGGCGSLSTASGVLDELAERVGEPHLARRSRPDAQERRLGDDDGDASRPRRRDVEPMPRVQERHAAGRVLG